MSPGGATPGPGSSLGPVSSRDAAPSPGAWPSCWRARWIWWEAPDLDGAFARGEAPPRPPDGFGYLRRAFSLPARPAVARCRVTADSRYALWVNGAELGRGPVRSYPWAWTYDEYDLTPHLRGGRNAVCALTRRYGGPTNAWVPPVPVGALGYGSFLFEAELGEEVLASDDAWRAMPAPYARARHEEGRPPDEVLDGRAIPHGWLEVGFDDGAWAHAHVVDPSGPGVVSPDPPADPFPVLMPRPVRHLAEHTVDAVARTTDGIARTVDAVARATDGIAPTVDGAGRTAAGTGDEVVDFGSILHAHPVLYVDADAGTVIEVTAGEALDDRGAPVTDVRAWRLRYTAAGTGDEIVEAFEPAGFRYARVEVPQGAARSVRVRARERVAPRPPGAAFRCDDADLEAIWRAGARTLEACTTDAFIDGPGREQRAWLGDAYGHALLDLMLDPDARMTRWMLRLHAAGARPDGLLPMVAAGDFALRSTTIPDFSLLWVLALAHAWRWTGDEELARELLPTAIRVLAWFERRRGDRGLLIDVPGWIFVDWAQLERGRTFAPLDGLYALALDGAAAVSRALGDARAGDALEQRAARTRAAFEAYWDPAREVYVDTAGGRRVSQHTNALAILCGAAERARWDPVLAHVLGDVRVRRTRTPGDGGTLGERVGSQLAPPEGFDDEVHVVEAQPFFSHFLHQAVARAGRGETLLRLIRRWAPPASKECFGEYWESRPGLASLCHAWSAVPLYDLVAHVAGVRPGSPGFATVEIRPAASGVGSIEAVVARPGGWLRATVRDGTSGVELIQGNAF